MAVSNKSTAKNNSKAAGSRKSTAVKKVTTNHSANKKASATGSSRRKSGGRSQESRRKSLEEMNAYQDHQAFEMGVTMFVILLLSVFLYLSYFGLAGKAGIVIGGLFFGVFGWFAWFLPIFGMIGFVFYMINRGDKRVPRRMFSFSGIVLTLMGLSDLLFEKQIITEYYISNHVLHKEYFECMFLTCEDVITRGKFNGGLIGRAVGAVFATFIGKVGAIIILFVLLLLCLYIFYGVEMMGMIRRRNAYRQEMSEIYQEVSKEEDYREPSYRVFSGVRENGGRHRNFVPREMERAPKVQTFDLQKMSGEADVQPIETTQKVVEDTKSVKKQSVGTTVEEKASEKVVLPVEEVKKEPSKKALETKKAVPVAVQEAVVTEEVKTAARQDEIPIYRNEMNEKFGKKRKADSAKVVSIAKATEKKVIEEEKAPERLLVADEEEEVPFVLNETAENVIENSSVFVEQSIEEESFSLFGEKKEENSSIENSGNLLESEKYAEAMQRAEKKPMASFAPKEEVTDVTPSCQKAAENVAAVTAPKPQVAAASVPKPAGVSGNRQQASSHGKIGGDDYVSASNTFNALNESKVAQEEELPYEFPPIDLLALPEDMPGHISDEELRMTASKLQDTLKSFNVDVKMGAVTCGPTVTRYELLPEQGVRVNKITNLADDLKLSLAASSIRIEAPIPGKAAVGIEVPNPVASSVYFRELLEGDAFTGSKSDLTFAVGKDIAGKLIMADIAKMPHLLIAGATGSGKSVCINTLIMSILYKADPKDVKLIMIDPKVVELSVYNGIPHLFCPVVTDPKEAAAALNWAVREMMDRYNKFKELGVRNIAGYNEKIKTVENAAAVGYGKMPYLVVIVDEFADLMMVASKEVEDAVCRLAQLARAAGIHLVLATQRPSVNVITGVIKANIPSRIAFSVSSVIDSRTILDKGGAEKLLGKGDMLFFPSGYSEPVRVQGAFVSDKEVSDVVDFLCSNNAVPEYDHSVTQVVEEPKEEETAVEKKSQDDRDEYFEDAGRFVIESDRAAAGQLQRRFSIGFNRAGRIIDQLHKAGVVGPAEGTKPRKVLMTIEQFERMLSGDDMDSSDMYSYGEVSDGEMEAMVREMEDVATEEGMEELF